MFWWLVGVIVCLAIWSLVWKRNVVLGLGILFGVLLAWLLSYAVKPYVTGSMEDIPVWLPPLPLATVAIVLLVYGVLVWIRGNEGLPKPEQRDDHEAH